jgi:high-affinity iron transporter
MLAVAIAVVIGLTTSASADAAVTRDDAIAQLDVVRASIDTSLSLLDAGKRDEAFAQAREGYLLHFEQVEIPLRVADPDLTVQAEGVFSEVRELIRSGASTAEVRAKLVELRGLIDESERRLTDVGVGAPALVFGQAFLIIFREGLEVVLLLAVLLGYLESSKAGHYRRPVLTGVALAVVASALTLVALQTVFAHLPVSREILEAGTSLAAVAVLFWVSFWLISRLDQKRWMEFLKARVWKAVSVGSTASLILLGFTAVYREGFETALFYQALLSFGTGLVGWVAAGLGAGLVALAAITTVIFRLGRKLPVATFLKVAVIAVMLTSVAFLGNAVHGLQEAFIVPRAALGVPRLPIFLSQATGFWPTMQTVGAQVVLALIYLAGGLYAFVIKPRRDRIDPVTPAAAAPAESTNGRTPPLASSASPVPAASTSA